MIVFVTTSQHRYTHDSVLAAAAESSTGVLDYEQLFAARELPRAIYVFTDADRLSPEHLRNAFAVSRQLREAGLRVLNDPARLYSRWGLLRALHARGFNHFNAYRLEEGVRPCRWPVFLGAEGDHKFPLSELLPSWDAVERAAEQATQLGIPRVALIVAEFAAEPLLPGIYRKLSVFRVGARSLPYTCVHQDHWIAKYGTDGLATKDLYADELRIMRENPYGKTLRPAFDLACVEYGRADFGLVGGLPQLYEINTNPNVELDRTHESPDRSESYRLFRRNYLDALRELDSARPG